MGPLAGHIDDALGVRILDVATAEREPEV